MTISESLPVPFPAGVSILYLSKSQIALDDVFSRLEVLKERRRYRVKGQDFIEK